MSDQGVRKTLYQKVSRAFACAGRVTRGVLTFWCLVRSSRRSQTGGCLPGRYHGKVGSFPSNAFPPVA